MAIIYDNESGIFHLKAGTSSYVMQIIRGQYLSHLYWGKQVG